MIRLKYDKSILLPYYEVVARGSANWENDAHLERHARTSVVHCNSQIQAMLENNCSYSEVLQLVLSPIKSLPKVPHKVLHLTPPTALVKYNLKCKSKLMYILTDDQPFWWSETVPSKSLSRADSKVWNPCQLGYRPFRISPQTICERYVSTRLKTSGKHWPPDPSYGN